jgi:sec-independent protein translocase protein TatC
VRSIIAFAAAFVICWTFSDRIYDFLAQPIYRYFPEGTKLVFLGVTDPFMIYMKVAALAAIFLASPIVLFQLWGFVAPGLYRNEKRLAAPFIIFGSLLFFAVKFLLEMGSQFQATITVTSYLSFLMTVILGLGLMFELPTLIFFLAKLGIVTPGFLMRHFRWAVLIIFVVAAVITPTPDIVNLCVFAVPALLLYLIGVGVAALFGKPMPKDSGTT